MVSNPPPDPTARQGFYGYGFDLGVNQAARTQISHSGAFYLGAGTNYIGIPALDLAIVTLTNASPSGAAKALSSYAGTYTSAYVGPMKVRRRHGQLQIKLGPREQAYPLQHWNGDQFVYRPVAENAQIGSVVKIEFARFRHGHPSRLTNELFNLDEHGQPNGLGHFRRD